MDFFMDHFALLKFELISDPKFRIMVSEMIRCFIQCDHFHQGYKYSNPEEYYDIDFEVPSENVEPFLKRMLMSYATHTELLGLWDYFIDQLTDEDRETLGFIASNFVVLLLIFDVDDLLFFDFGNRVAESRRAFIDTFGIEPPPLGT